ncbi:MAG: nicotinate-nucleotide adenylyltransferase NadD [Rhodobacteraceae bacterium HLUCCA08]|nr:MAG: nicotinate-nucleotide adenylyltransferase NadD [Rhodobacteraceae bacterium HLUCCA08]
MLRHEMPYAPPGRVVGLLGGSFDPAHGGHVAISRAALAQFGLDRVWWLVSPGNPLKTRGPAPMTTRIAAARAVLGGDPRVTVTGIEARLGTRYTAQTLAHLHRLYPRVRFVWLMGADNLAQLHLWQDWRQILDHVPVGVLARPGLRISARMSVAARSYRAARLLRPDLRRLGLARTPAWAFANMPMSDASSSAIRAGGGWIRGAGVAAAANPD